MRAPHAGQAATAFVVVKAALDAAATCSAAAAIARKYIDPAEKVDRALDAALPPVKTTGNDFNACVEQYITAAPPRGASQQCFQQLLMQFDLFRYTGPASQREFDLRLFL